jgi:malate dehydrogenase (oxaloacetate-decarboxylating)
MMRRTTKSSKRKTKKISRLKISPPQALSFILMPHLHSSSQKVVFSPVLRTDIRLHKKTIAFVTDGSSIEGLKISDRKAVLPFMDERIAEFQHLTDIHACPLYFIDYTDQKILSALRTVSSFFAGIYLVHMEQNRAERIQQALSSHIAVFHDESDGLPITILSGMINAALLAGKKLSDMKIVIGGTNATARGLKQLLSSSFSDGKIKLPVREVTFMEEQDQNILRQTDIFVGLDSRFIPKKEGISLMNRKPVILLNATEDFNAAIREAKISGAFIMATKLKDFPNYINERLVIPSFLKAFLDQDTTTISLRMKLRAASLLAEKTEQLNAESIFPQRLTKKTVGRMAREIHRSLKKERYVS